MQAQALAAQTQTQHTLQSSALVSQALLDQATTSAANLHALIDEAATKYKHNPGLHFTGTTIWTMFLAFLIAMGSQSPKFAVSIFFLIFGRCPVGQIGGMPANHCANYRPFDRYMVPSIFLIIRYFMLVIESAFRICCFGIFALYQIPLLFHIQEAHSVVSDSIPFLISI